MTFEDEGLVLEERGEPPIEPNPKVLGLCPDLAENVGIETGNGLLFKKHQYLAKFYFPHTGQVGLHYANWSSYVHVVTLYLPASNCSIM